jgi:hypothetical protein
MHIILCRKGDNHAETGGMRDWAESVLKIPTTLFILSKSFDAYAELGRRDTPCTFRISLAYAQFYSESEWRRPS